MNIQSNAIMRRFGVERLSVAQSVGLLKKHWLTAIVLAIPIAFMSVVATQPWIDPAMLLRDPLAVAELVPAGCCKVYYGAVSSLGVLLWAAGAAICLFAACLVLALRRGFYALAFLVSGGLLTGFLAIDDLFLVHENVLPAFGVPEPVTYGAYLAAGLGYLAVSWRQIMAHDYALFFAAAGLLVLSAMIDWQFHSEHPLRIVLEDGAKFAGIFAWVTFHATAAGRILADSAGPAVLRRVSRKAG
jgi:hypothetical protein